MKNYKLYILTVGILATLTWRAEALFPTLDPGAIAGTIKTNVEQVKQTKIIVDATTTMGKINSTVGDAKSSVSKFAGDNIEKAKEKKEKYDEFNKDLEEKRDQYNEYTARIEEEKARAEAAQGKLSAGRKKYQELTDNMYNKDNSTDDSSSPSSESSTPQSGTTSSRVESSTSTSGSASLETDTYVREVEAPNSDGKIYDDGDVDLRDYSAQQNTSSSASETTDSPFAGSSGEGAVSGDQGAVSGSEEGMGIAPAQGTGSPFDDAVNAATGVATNPATTVQNANSQLADTFGYNPQPSAAAASGAPADSSTSAEPAKASSASGNAAAINANEAARTSSRITSDSTRRAVSTQNDSAASSASAQAPAYRASTSANRRSNQDSATDKSAENAQETVQTINYNTTAPVQNRVAPSRAKSASSELEMFDDAYENYDNALAPASEIGAVNAAPVTRIPVPVVNTNNAAAHAAAAASAAASKNGVENSSEDNPLKPASSNPLKPASEGFRKRPAQQLQKNSFNSYMFKEELAFAQLLISDVPDTELLRYCDISEKELADTKQTYDCQIKLLKCMNDPDSKVAQGCKDLYDTIYLEETIKTNSNMIAANYKSAQYEAVLERMNDQIAQGKTIHDDINNLAVVNRDMLKQMNEFIKVYSDLIKLNNLGKFPSFDRKTIESLETDKELDDQAKGNSA